MGSVGLFVGREASVFPGWLLLPDFHGGDGDHGRIRLWL